MSFHTFHFLDPKCPELSIENGYVNVSGYQYGDLAVYFCNDGYNFYGDELRECMDYGIWSGESSICNSKLRNIPVLFHRLYHISIYLHYNIINFFF